MIEVLDPVNASLSDIGRTSCQVKGVRVRWTSFDARPLCVVWVFQVVVSQAFTCAHVDCLVDVCPICWGRSENLAPIAIAHLWVRQIPRWECLKHICDALFCFDPSLSPSTSTSCVCSTKMDLRTRASAKQTQSTAAKTLALN